MINFKNVELNDKQWMEPLIAKADMRACHQNFTNILAWSEIYNYRVAQVHDFLVVKGRLDEQHYYFYPAGQGDIKVVLEEMKQDALDCGHDLVLFGVSPENIEEMNRVFPEQFEFQEMRDSFDYVYLLEKLVSLSGNKLHSKRNHINRFKQNNSWSFELITPENIAECWEMNLAWCEQHEANKEEIAKESCAVRRCFENFGPLGLEGGLIRVDEKVIAYTMGERLNSDTYVIHIEKAFGEIQGAYQIINREFAEFVQMNYSQLLYMNREEDMGLEGLRKAKSSYYPFRMEEKFIARHFEV